MTQDNNILLQQRDPDARAWPNMIGMFAGGLEPGENPSVALCRELQEELEVTLQPDEVKFIVAILHTDLDGEKSLGITFFWHDRQGKVGNCHEGKKILFNSAVAALTQDNLTPTARVTLKEYLRRGLIA